MNHWQFKVVLDCNNLAIWTLCVSEPLEQLSTMLLLVNIVWDSFLGKTSYAHVVYIQSKLGNISCINIRDLTNIGILKEIL